MQKQENCFRNNSLAEVFHKFTLLKTRVLIRRLRYIVKKRLTSDYQNGKYKVYKRQPNEGE